MNVSFLSKGSLPPPRKASTGKLNHTILFRRNGGGRGNTEEDMIAATWADKGESKYSDEKNTDAGISKIWLERKFLHLTEKRGVRLRSGVPHAQISNQGSSRPVLKGKEKKLYLFCSPSQK